MAFAASLALSDAMVVTKDDMVSVVHMANMPAGVMVVASDAGDCERDISWPHTGQRSCRQGDDHRIAAITFSHLISGIWQAIDNRCNLKSKEKQLVVRFNLVSY